MTDPKEETPATPADRVASPVQPPVEDASGNVEAEEKAAKLGDFA